MSGLPSAVLFDWDGTLVDSWPVIHESMNRALAAMGHRSWTLEETTARARRSLREAFPAIFGERWKEAREIFYAEYRAIHLERVRRLEGAEDLLAALHGRGCCLGVVSNKSGRHLRAESTHLGWNRFFGGRLVGAGDAGRDKPSVEPVFLALEGTGIAPSPDVWFVGDTWVDIACGRGAGCRTLLVGAADAGEFGEHLPDERFASPGALLEVVRGL